MPHYHKDKCDRFMTENMTDKAIRNMSDFLKIRGREREWRKSFEKGSAASIFLHISRSISNRYKSDRFFLKNLSTDK